MISLPVKRGEFVALEASSGTIGVGESGTLRTITPPSGQRVRLTHLSTTSPVIQVNITLRFGAVDLVTAKSVKGDIPQADHTRQAHHQTATTGM